MGRIWPTITRADPSYDARRRCFRPALPSAGPGEGTGFRGGRLRDALFDATLSISAAGIRVTFVVALVSLWCHANSWAETISGALTKAYVNNPTIGAERAATRAADEGVAQANAGLRPRVDADGFVGAGYAQGFDIGGLTDSFARPVAGGLTVTQNVFNGNRTINGVRQAESQVFSSRERLRLVEQGILRDAAAAYMDVLRDTAIVDLYANNIAVLREQLRHTRDRYLGGFLSVTDVAQAAASLALARSDYATARTKLQSSVADFRRVVGVQPKRLEAARPIDALLPPSVEAAVTVAVQEHPSVVEALHQIDAAVLQVKLEEGRLYPTIDASTNVQRADDSQGSIGDDKVSPGDRVFAVGASLRSTFPVYTGGEVDAAVRRSKELLGQVRLRADLKRRDVRAAVEIAWGRLRAARELIPSSIAAIKAAESALYSVREEADAGQRTTLDVLRAQQALLRARVDLVRAQRDRIVRGYDVMAAIGHLSVVNLGLSARPYDPTVHFNGVKDRWFGLRTPDGQ